MTELDQLERSLRAADPVGAGDEPPPDLIVQAQAIMDRDRPARPLPVRRRRRLVPLAATAGALAVGIAVAFAVLPGSERTGLPRPVAAFAQQLDERRGVLHLRMSGDRALPEPGLPDLPDPGIEDEIWLDLGGTGWRHVRTITTGSVKGGTVEQYADERGVHLVPHGDLPECAGDRPRRGSACFVPTQSPEDAWQDYLHKPVSGVIAEPSELVRSGQLEIVGEETINGRPAYVVAVKRNRPAIVPDTDDPRNARIYIAKDDGDLLRVRFRMRAGITEDETPMRTFVRDYPLYEILPSTPENLALIRPPASR